MKGLRKIYYIPCIYQCQYPCYVNIPMFNYGTEFIADAFLNEEGRNYEALHSFQNDNRIPLTDYGKEPLVVNINEAAKRNDTYRTALWTGSNLQVTLMSIAVGDDIGLEIHPDNDQFLRVEQGQGIVQMGMREDNLTIQRQLTDDSAIMVPAGTWHNITNTGNSPLKLYAIYAPPHHPFGTVHATKEDALAAENHANL